MVDEAGEVVKWYTRARKFPTLIGKTPDGTRLPGGPYTITQVLVGGALAVLLASPPWWWTRFFDPMTNVAIFVLVVGAIVSIGAWQLNEKTEVELPPGCIFYPGGASALSLVLLIFSV